MKLLSKSGFELNTLIKNRLGPLEPEFSGLSEFCDYSYKIADSQSLLSKIKNRLKRNDNLTDLTPLLAGVDFIINNTITNGNLIEQIRKQFNGPILTYVHELSVASRTFTSPTELDKTIRLSDLFLVPSDSVRNFLMNELSVADHRINRLNYFFENALLEKRRVKADSPKFIVGGCGTLDWRKGIDVFLQVAAYVHHNYPGSQIEFVWKGAHFNSPDYYKAMHDAERLGIISRFRFLESSGNTDDFYRSLDLFLLTSREDPYPLVVLEAAAYQLSSIAFDKSGGAPEFIKAYNGDVISYLDVRQMAETVQAYYNDRTIGRTTGELASKKFKELHGEKSMILNQFNSALRNASMERQKSNSTEIPAEHGL